jgi:hypothetical protein
VLITVLTSIQRTRLFGKGADRRSVDRLGSTERDILKYWI